MDLYNIITKVEAVDLSSFLARDAELAEQRAEIEAAKARGLARRNELHAMRQALRDRQISGTDAAEALLAGVDVDTLAVDDIALVGELELIGKALGELDRRERDIEPEVNANRSDAADAIRDHIVDDVAHLQAEVRRVATELAGLYAAVATVAGTLRHGEMNNLERDMRTAIIELSSAGIIAKSIELPDGASDFRFLDAREFIRGSVPANPIKIWMLHNQSQTAAVAAAIASTISRSVD